MITKGVYAKRIALIIALVMVMTTALGSMTISYATLTKAPDPVQIESISSSDYYDGEYYTVTTPFDEDSVIYVEGRTQIHAKMLCIRLQAHGNTSGAKYPITVFVVPDDNGEFSIRINTAYGNRDYIEVYQGSLPEQRCYDVRPGYKAVETIAAGTYHLTIARAKSDESDNISPGSNWASGPLGGSKGYAWKEALLTVESGDENNPKVIAYDKAIDNNENTTYKYEKNSTQTASYKGSYVRYMDPYLKDMAFVLNNPAEDKYEYLTAANVDYLKRTAESLTAGITSDYDKLLKFYEYAGQNFYYDVLANEQYKNQYANPYQNIYKLDNKINSANSKNGKVATTCQGFASIVIALARAEGIPARLAYGHHISQPITTWATNKSDISQRDHWWAEAWLADEERWVVIDADASSSSEWNRSGWNAAGTWTLSNEFAYVHFDPSPEQLSTSYAYIDIYPGATDGKYISNAKEVNQLKTFLNTKSSGKTNGKRLNTKYAAANFSTWGTTASDDFLTDGYGRVTHIKWPKKALSAATMNLSNFTQLRYLTISDNNIKGLNLTGCSSLQKVTAKGNKLTTAKIKIGTKTVNISRNVAGGTFSFNYNKANSKSMTLYVSNPAKGYKYLGIYNGSGKKLTSGKTYTFKPTATKYVVKFKKK